MSGIFSIIAFLTLSASTSLASSADPKWSQDFSFEKMGEYLPIGSYQGSDCRVTVDENYGINVVDKESSESFNHFVGRVANVREEAEDGRYFATMDQLPNDSYSGIFRHEVTIETNGRGRTSVTVESKRRFFGGWIGNRSATCLLRN